MSLTYKEYKEKQIKETLDFHGVTAWHKLGYKGKGKKILLLEDINSTSGHGKNVLDRIKLGLPEADVDWITPQFGLDNDVIYNFKANNDDIIIEDLETFEKYIDYYDIITVSKGTDYGTQLDEIFKKKICITSAGNTFGGEITDAFQGYGLQVASVRLLSNGNLAGTNYNPEGEGIDFSALTFDLRGTSFSSPVIVIMAALILEKYGYVDSRKMREVLKTLYTQDEKYKVPALPENGIIKILKAPTVEHPEPKPEVVNNMNMYLVRYGHLERILVNVGDVCQADITWSGKLSPATQIGISGNTGISTGTHTHIDVVRVPYDPNFRYKKYTQQDIFNGNPPADKEELHYFADDTLFKAPLVITTHYLSKEYEKQFNRVHPALDVVSQGAKIIYWNRSTRGRVVHTGYDNGYGNNVVIAFFDVSFDSYEK